MRHFDSWICIYHYIYNALQHLAANCQPFPCRNVHRLEKAKLWWKRKNVKEKRSANPQHCPLYPIVSFSVSELLDSIELIEWDCDSCQIFFCFLVIQGMKKYCKQNAHRFCFVCFWMCVFPWHFACVTYYAIILGWGSGSWVCLLASFCGRWEQGESIATPGDCTFFNLSRWAEPAESLNRQQSLEITNVTVEAVWEQHQDIKQFLVTTMFLHVNGPLHKIN